MILEAVPVPLSPADQTVMNRMPVDYAEALVPARLNAPRGSCAPTARTG
ncbi:hypothetical protein [Streptomyces sp. NBC_01320]|nr:hypothetical protein OG395_00825 [Streptomyces sp. NBC_01320]WSK01078.1 hypothetical protein OG395_54530 [Streptomyces sp. NBC_01320]